MREMICSGVASEGVVRCSATTVRNGPVREGDIIAWESHIRKGTAGSFYLHPKLVLSDLNDYQGSWIYIVPGNSSQDEELGGLAVLCPKGIKVRPLPIPLGTFSLKGYRLAGDQVVPATHLEVVTKIVQAVARLLSERETECLLFEEIECDSVLWKAVHRVATERGKQISVFYPSLPQTHHSIRFPDTPGDYWKQFSRKTRYNLSYNVKRFEHRLVKYTAPSDLPVFLEKAHAVSTRSWQAALMGVRVRNSPEERQHWGQIAELGAFRSYILEHAGTPVAFLIGTYWNGYYIYEETGYEQAHFQHSPGTVLLYRVIEEMIAIDTPRVFDFGAGDAEHKRMFSTHHIRSGPILLASRTPRAIFLQVERLSVLAVRAARAVARRIGIFSYFRRRSRRRSVKESE